MMEVDKIGYISMQYSLPKPPNIYYSFPAAHAYAVLVLELCASELWH